LIFTSDGIIAIIDGSISYGTLHEMVYAHLYGKKVFAVITNGHIGHPWLRHHSTKAFVDLDGLEDFLIGYVDE
jgi:hypothetical protein